VIGKHRPAGLDAGTYDVIRVSTKGVVSLRDSEGRTIKFSPDRLDASDKHDSLALSQRENLVLYEGDRIRWTANDKQRGLLNSAQAQVVAITREGVEVRTGDGVNMLLPHGDRMLSRLGLAYAINMHQAQGMTTDNGIGVMHSAERHLSSQRLTHVMATRVRDELTIFTDDRDALLRAVESNAGDKASALEHVGKAASSASPGSQGRDDEAPAGLVMARAMSLSRSMVRRFAAGQIGKHRPCRSQAAHHRRKNRWSWDCDPGRRHVGRSAAGGASQWGMVRQCSTLGSVLTDTKDDLCQHRDKNGPGTGLKRGQLG
jgi:hypothetical protein